MVGGRLLEVGGVVCRAEGRSALAKASGLRQVAPLSLHSFRAARRRRAIEAKDEKFATKEKEIQELRERLAHAQRELADWRWWWWQEQQVMQMVQQGGVASMPSTEDPAVEVITLDVEPRDTMDNVKDMLEQKSLEAVVTSVQDVDLAQDPAQECVDELDAWAAVGGLVPDADALLAVRDWWQREDDRDGELELSWRGYIQKVMDAMVLEVPLRMPAELLLALAVASFLRVDDLCNGVWEDHDPADAVEQMKEVAMGWLQELTLLGG